jgi:plasmid stabilization system protein ParE
MNIRKSDAFIADVEHQFEWYVRKAGWDIAERYLDAVESTCRLLAQYPHLGPQARFDHPQLRGWRFFVIFRPFKKHLVFYEASGTEIIMRRAMHGHRDLSSRLLEKR